MTVNRSQIFSNVQRLVNSMDDTKVTAMISQYRKAGEGGIVKGIQGRADVMEEYKSVCLFMFLVERHNTVASQVSLADKIWYQQGQSLAQYGEKAFRLSEKQIAAIAQYFMNSTGSLSTTMTEILKQYE